MPRRWPLLFHGCHFSSFESSCRTHHTGVAQRWSLFTHAIPLPSPAAVWVPAPVSPTAASRAAQRSEAQRMGGPKGGRRPSPAPSEAVDDSFDVVPRSGWGWHHHGQAWTRPCAPGSGAAGGGRGRRAAPAAAAAAAPLASIVCAHSCHAPASDRAGRHRPRLLSHVTHPPPAPAVMAGTPLDSKQPGLHLPFLPVCLGAPRHRRQAIVIESPAVDQPLPKARRAPRAPGGRDAVVRGRQAAL